MSRSVRMDYDTLRARETTRQIEHPTRRHNMNARDELAGKVANVVCSVSRYPARAQAYLLGGDMSEVINALTGAILAAGYRKPRTVTTVDELDALPVESVVRSDMGNVFEKDYDLDNPSDTWWTTMGTDNELPSILILLPATVLHEPGVGA